LILFELIYLNKRPNTYRKMWMLRWRCGIGEWWTASQGQH